MNSQEIKDAISNIFDTLNINIDILDFDHHSGK
jgi:hypothetical protein